jgi:hypothetical protein
MDLIKERDAALKKARGFARGGHGAMAQAFITHANAFFPVSDRQVANVQKLLNTFRSQQTGGQHSHGLPL